MTNPKTAEDARDQERADEQLYDDLLDLIRYAKGLGWKDHEIKNAVKEILEVLSME